MIPILVQRSVPPKLKRKVLLKLHFLASPHGRGKWDEMGLPLPEFRLTSGLPRLALFEVIRAWHHMTQIDTNKIQTIPSTSDFRRDWVRLVCSKKQVNAFGQINIITWSCLIKNSKCISVSSACWTKSLATVWESNSLLGRKLLVSSHSAYLGKVVENLKPSH